MSESAQDADRREVETWFRRRGLPYVVRRKLQGSGLVPRAAPALVALMALDPLLSKYGALVAANHDDFVRRGDNPAYVTIQLVVLGAALVVPVLLGWLTSLLLRRMRRPGRRVLGWTILVLAIAVVPAIEEWTGLHDGLRQYLLTNVLPVPLLLLLVFFGAGAILRWALDNGISQLRWIGNLASRALPLLMLVVLFSFFASEVWQVAESLARGRLWTVIGFLAALAVLLLIAVLSDELRTMVSTLKAVPVSELREHVMGTPLAGWIDDDHVKQEHPLTKGERANISLLLFFAQALQIAVFSLMVFGLFMVFGALAVPQSVVAAWVGKEPNPGVLIGVHLPVPNALIQVSLFLAMFSGLYFAASVATDQHYRKSFFLPLLKDMRVSLAAREVYLTRLPTADQAR